MKFARGFFTCILIILASHGAYQIYKQYFRAPFQVSDDVRKELQSAGIHLEEMVADENGVTNLFSDSGHFGSYAEKANSSSMPPSFFNPGSATIPISQAPQQPSTVVPLPPPPPPPVTVVASPVLPYANSFASLPPAPEPPASKTEISEIPAAVQPFAVPVLPPTPESQSVAVTAPLPTPIPAVNSEDTTKPMLEPLAGLPVTGAPPAIVDHGTFSDFAVMNAVKPNETPGMNSIVPSPIMIDDTPEETQPHDVPPLAASPADSLSSPDGFAVSGKKAPGAEILPVNSMSSARPFDVVTPLPSILDEKDRNNIAGEVRPEIVSQCESIFPLFDSQDIAKIKEGYFQLNRLYFNKNLTPDELRYVGAPLSQVAGGLFFSNQMHILEPPYLVKEGESMESIAADLKVTPELLRKINGFAAQTNLQPGMQIKVIRGPLEAKVMPNTCELIILSDGHYVCRFKIGVGLNYAGQRGTFAVHEKTINPIYDLGFGLDRIEAGDPSNPLGCRWIKLSQMANNIGIHGTNRPDLVGVRDRAVVPPGVFFMKNEDVLEVCDMLVPGSQVVIER